MAAKVNVLVVDDDRNSVKTLVAILNLKGFRASGATSGKEALEILRQTKMDLILSDVKMLEMNGVELYRQTKGLEPSIPFILVTAYAHAELIQQGLDEGIKAVLPKPLDIDELISKIHALIH